MHIPMSQPTWWRGGRGLPSLIALFGMLLVRTICALRGLVISHRHGAAVRDKCITTVQRFLGHYCFSPQFCVHMHIPTRVMIGTDRYENTLITDPNICTA